MRMTFTFHPTDTPALRRLCGIAVWPKYVNANLPTHVARQLRAERRRARNTPRRLIRMTGHRS